MTIPISKKKDTEYPEGTRFRKIRIVKYIKIKPITKRISIRFFFKFLSNKLERSFQFNLIE